MLLVRVYGEATRSRRARVDPGLTVGSSGDLAERSHSGGPRRLGATSPRSRRARGTARVLQVQTFLTERTREASAGALPWFNSWDMTRIGWSTWWKNALYPEHR